MRLLAPRRREFLAVALLAALVTIALGVHYSGHQLPGAFDRGVDDWLVARFRRDDGLARLFADLGGSVPVASTAFVLVVAEVCLHSARGAVLAALAPFVSSALTESLLKPAFGRTFGAPYEPGFSYPSGHATGAITVLTVICVLAFHHLGPDRRRTRARIVAVCLLLALAIVVGLIADQFHYATDTVGGIGVAVAAVLGLSVVIDLLFAEVARRKARGLDVSA